MDEEGHRSTYQSKNCDLCTADDDEILVSVSPRRFTLPPANEKRTKMEIKNKNPFTIYFKAGTSNTDVFRPQPNIGRIAPNSKVSLVVTFFDSVTPIRLHEEVVVLTSVKPFELYTEYKGSVCPYCYESVHVSKHHNFTSVHPTHHVDGTEEHCRFHRGQYPKVTNDTDVVNNDTSGTRNERKLTGCFENESLENTAEPSDENTGIGKENHASISTQSNEKLDNPENDHFPGSQLPRYTILECEDSQSKEQVVDNKYASGIKKENASLKKTAGHSEECPENPIHANEEFENSEENRRFHRGQLPRYTILECKDSQDEQEQVIETKYTLSIEKEIKSTDASQEHFESLEKAATHSEERAEIEKDGHHVMRSRHVNGKIELEEICLHAFIHRPAKGSCGCKNCTELYIGIDNVTKIRDIQHEKRMIGRRLSEPTRSSVSMLDTIPKTVEVETTYDVHKRHKNADAREVSKKRVTEPHIIARIIKSVERKDTSDAETSETSSKEEMRKRLKIITEDDYKRKIEKLKKKKYLKYLKQLEEESKSSSTTTTEEDVTIIKERERSPRKKDEMSTPIISESLTLSSIESKVNWLLPVTFTITIITAATFFLVLILLIVFFFNCCHSKNYYYRALCFWDNFM